MTRNSRICPVAVVTAYGARPLGVRWRVFFCGTVLVLPDLASFLAH